MKRAKTRKTVQQEATELEAQLAKLRARAAVVPDAHRNGAAPAARTAGDEPKSGVWTVTPAIASAWLSRNTLNRHLSPWRVGNLAKEILAGRWKRTHQGIAFGASGQLLDGQHRLAAIVEAGMPCEVLVTCDLDDGARAVIDTGRARTGADTLTMQGVPNATLIVSIFSIETQFQTKVARAVTTNARMLEMLEANPDVHDAATAISRHRHDLAGWMHPSILGWWYWRARRAEPDKAAEFLEQVATGAGLVPGSPALAVRNRFSAVHRSVAPRADRPDALYMLCSAWDAFCAGRPLMKSQLPKPGNALEKLAGPGMT